MHSLILVLGEDVEERLDYFSEEMNLTSFIDETDYVTEEFNNGENSKYDNVYDYAHDYYGYVQNGSKIGYYENPNAEFDWYQIGGRWYNSLILKEGVDKDEIGEPSFMWSAKNQQVLDHGTNSALYKDLDLESMKSIFPDSFSEEYNFINVFGVLNQNNEWITQDSMKDESEWNAFMKETFVNLVNKDTLLTLVDCHN